MSETGSKRPDDQAIGERVKSARGSTAQTVVAKEMKELGHKWSQATVWAVEKGERSLKLPEGRDLAMILGVSVLDLLEDQAGSDLYVWIRRELAEANRGSDRLLEALIEWAARRQRVFLTGQAIDDPEVMQQIPESKRSIVKRDIINAANLTLKDVVDHILSDELDTSRLEELDEGDDSPVDVSDWGDLRILRDDWRQLRDPENEERYRQMMEQITEKHANRRQRDGFDQET
ncbi:hypothetical protein CXR25_13680 [Brevibacterium aurantiacum]|uniref:hypothetical protein n=1 Tax=Brevibacterium aurantiacum TaxID=273384 RepID=UPI000F6528E9|nr:hypothetical protein [Brevibacterium aurantiacum]AZL13747.1 hypothetical protein CXR25_13680 [Brevibacterium aurantiacum]